MSLRRVNVNDLFGVTSQRTITEEGYLVVPGAVARTGVQDYRAGELGLDAAGADASKVVRLYRPADEVFHPNSLASFAAKPVTINHPPEGVNADNWKAKAVGDVHDVAKAGDLMSAKLIIRDKAAIRAVMDGKQQLSNGYSFDLDMTPGTAPDGSAYDGIQRNIRGNHVAIVDCARGGPSLRIADQKPGEQPMATKTIVIDGISIELETLQASLVEKIVGDAKKNEKAAIDLATAAEARAVAADAALAAEKTASAKIVADHAVAIAELNKQILKPEQIEAMATERAKVVGDAAKLAPELKPEGKTIAAIRTEVLTEVLAKDSALKPIALAVLGGAEPAKASDVIVTAAFSAIAAASPAATNAADSQRRTADDSVSRALLGADATHVTDGPELTGRALMIFRESHGGRSPAEEKKFQQERRQ